MNSARKHNRQALDQLLSRNPTPTSAEMQPRLNTIWGRLRYEIENTATERVSISVSIRPSWAFGKKAWVIVGIALAAVLVSALVWRHRPPFSLAGKNANESSLSKSSAEQARETLQVTGPQ